MKRLILEKINKRIIVFSVIFTLVFYPLVFSVKKAEAFGFSGLAGGLLGGGNEVPVSEKLQRSKEVSTGNLGGLFGKIGGFIGGEAGKATGEKIGSKISLPSWDAIAWTMAKLAIKKITKSTVDWINSGFSGRPLFLSDPEGFFTDVADQVSGRVIEKMRLANLCSPFRLNIIIGPGRVETFEDRLYCTATRVKENFERNFLDGGWDAWLEHIQPNNNVYGVYFAYVDELNSEYENQKESYMQDLNRGNGFFSFRKCAEYRPEYDRCVNVDRFPKEKCENLYCGRWESVTPGNVIAEQLNLNLGSSVRQLELADELSESLEAIFDALLNQLINKGLKSLSERNPGGPSNNWYQTPLSEQARQTYDTTAYDALDIESSYLETVGESINKAEEIVNTLNSLKECDDNLSTTTPSWVDGKINDLQNVVLPQLIENQNYSKTWLETGNGYAERMAQFSGESDDFNKLFQEFNTSVLPKLHTEENYRDASNLLDDLKASLSDAQKAYNACQSLLEQKKAIRITSPGSSFGSSSEEGSTENPPENPPEESP